MNLGALSLSNECWPRGLYNYPVGSMTGETNIDGHKRYFQHQTAIVETSRIGDRTRIWAFAHVLPGAAIGADCNVCDHTFIENDVVVGDRVTIKCGVQLWDGVTLEDDVFIGPNASFTNDHFPQSGQHQAAVLRTTVQKGASIGANATILPGITIGEGAMIGAGSVVTHDVPRHAIVTGNPGRISGYVDTMTARVNPLSVPADAPGAYPSIVRGVVLHRLPRVVDLRGKLTFSDGGRQFPFEVKRFFLVFDVTSREVRGEHAHRTLHEILVCIHGSCSCVADDGGRRQEFLLNDPTLALYLPPMTWTVQYKYSADAVLLALVSEEYDASEYIRDYTEFAALISMERQGERASPSEPSGPA
jgi:UDP-2-acetamido-3-amino-2,3-dideoxy-glucuronate N-acetyltransferase